MKIHLRAGLLAAALVLPSASPAAEKAAPAAPWVKAKDDARRWIDAVLASAAKSGQSADLRSELETAWARAAGAEAAERRLNDKRLVAAPKQAAQSQRLLELDLLYLYGRVLPRLLDESAMNDAPGRGRAGGEWANVIDEESYREQSAALRKTLSVPAELAPENLAL
ncbi:MAG TPA: hypothetical protein VN915_17050 [Elusimicrobiota bacterium]|nr:hypothetical protein [Elusimicrobiota bacterium]